MKELFNELERILMLRDASEKCLATESLMKQLDQFEQQHDSPPRAIAQPGLPVGLSLVAPRQLKRRSIQSQAGRSVLMHAIAHIEFNAINLALDAAYRFRQQPPQYYRDWIGVAADEARHFSLLRAYLQNNDCDYGEHPAHNGLWEMAVQTADDVVARMALVPRVLEARGLDVTPGMIERLTRVNDVAATDILEIIYQDEIGHVAIGSHWFFYHCELSGLEPRSTFLNMIKTHLHGELKGPFNTRARLEAGFDQQEMTYLNNHY